MPLCGTGRRSSRPSPGRWSRRCCGPPLRTTPAGALSWAWSCLLLGVARVLPRDDIRVPIADVAADTHVLRAGPQPVPLVDGRDRDALPFGKIIRTEMPWAILCVHPTPPGVFFSRAGVPERNLRLSPNVCQQLVLVCSCDTERERSFCVSARRSVKSTTLSTA